MADPDRLVELETCRERLAAAERRLSEAAWRVGDGPFPVTHVYNPETGLWDRVRESDVLRLESARSEVAESRAGRLAAALEHVRDHLYGAECREYHAGLNDGPYPSLVLLQIIETALAAAAAGEGMQASQVSDVTASDDAAAGDAHGR